MTGLPAKHMGLSDRGVLAPGKAADITVFDFDSIRDRSSYGNSVVKPEGIVHVMVSAPSPCKTAS
jgi:N-acyl-D-amino-acid deacylase